MTTRLPLPLRRVLREPLGDDAIERLVAGASGLPARPRVSRTVVGAGVIAMAALALIVAWPSEGDVPALRDASGAPLAERIAPRVPTSVSLDDGSVLTLGETASLVTLENDAHDVSFLLETGSVTFDVRPHGPRRWTIECGLASVTVVGTRFTLTRSPQRLEVSVARGVVLVRGERVPDHARRLGAGESIEIVDEEPTVAPVEVPNAATLEPALAAPVHSDAVPPPSVARTSPIAWRALAAETRWDDAYRSLGAVGVADASEEASSVDDLLVLADVARLSGHPADAIRPLERVVAEHASDPRASLTAFSLGRVQDRLGHPDRAARAFEQALSLGGLPAGLRMDALARRASALESAGDHAGAVQSARAYLEVQPDGRDATAMRVIAESP